MLLWKIYGKDPRLHCPSQNIHYRSSIRLQIIPQENILQNSTSIGRPNDTSIDIHWKYTIIDLICFIKYSLNLNIIGLMGLHKKPRLYIYHDYTWLMSKNIFEKIDVIFLEMNLQKYTRDHWPDGPLKNSL